MQSKDSEKASSASDPMTIQIKGKPIGPGIGIGIALVLESDIQVPQFSIPPHEIEAEKKRYEKAIELFSNELHSQVQAVRGGYIFDAHQLLKIHELLLNDGEYHKKVYERIEKERTNAEWALHEESVHVINSLERTRDALFIARAEDVRDLTDNILFALLKPLELPGRLRRKADQTQILFSKRLYLSEIMMAGDQHVAGFVTESSAFSSHAAILLKSFGIPSLGGVKNVTGLVRNGNLVIVDSLEGTVMLRPDPHTVSKYQDVTRKIEKKIGKRRYVPLQTSTRDGVNVHVMANVNNVKQVDLVLENRMEGVGLFRTEFLVLADNRIPSENEQHSVYRKVLETLRGRPVVMRTFDIGGDKLLTDWSTRGTRNPALGIRGIRRQLLLYPQELMVQMRAILRAAVDSNVGILLPMVTMAEELKEVKERIAEARHQLRTEGLPFSSNVNLGAMIEIPAAAFAIEEILKEVDFLSIGTNDLIQYFTAADRDNEAVLHYGDMKNKPVRDLLNIIIKQATEIGRQQDVTVCGEIASEPANIELLLRMGYRSLSIPPVAAPSIRQAIRDTDLQRSNGVGR